MESKPISYKVDITVNGLSISTVKIGRHYLKKHSSYMNDQLILELVKILDGGNFPAESTTNGVDYYVADVILDDPRKIYRLVWLFEGESLEILGIINAYRRKKRGKS